MPVLDDGAFDLEAQKELSSEYNQITDAVGAVEEALAQLADMKPRADLPNDATDLGLQVGSTMTTKKRTRRQPSRVDRIDADIARKRLREIADDPSLLVTGKELSKRLSELK